MKIHLTVCDGCGKDILKEKFEEDHYKGTFQGYGLSIRRNSISGSGTGEMMTYFVNDELCKECKDAVVEMLAKRRTVK